MKNRVHKETKSKFIKVHCEKCKNQQNIFDSVSSKVVCLVCNEVLAEPTGGKSRIKSSKVEYLH